MATNTANYNMVKPSSNENVDLGVINSNYDLIDAIMAQNSALVLSTMGYTRKNMLKNTAISSTTNGVTFTVNPDGTITANGTSTDITSFAIVPMYTVKSGKYILSGCPSGGSPSTYKIDCYEDKTPPINDFGDGVELDLSVDTTYVEFKIVVYSGVTINNLVFKPMLRYANITDDTYEKYKPSIQDQIDELKSALLSTSANV